MNEEVEKKRHIYSGIIRGIKRYWNFYGGWKELFSSAYFHFALFLTVILFPFWSRPLWWETVISILPNLIGFSLGGYAILLAFGDEDFQILLSKSSDDEKSPFMTVSSAFAHFLYVQFLALLLALFAKAYYLPMPQWIQTGIKGLGVEPNTVIECLQFLIWSSSFLIFIYALALGIAATAGIFRVSSWFNRYRNSINKK